MSLWRKKANELTEKSKLASWEDNARRRGISECDNEGKPKSWEILKWECGKYEKQKRDRAEQERLEKEDRD